MSSQCTRRKQSRALLTIFGAGAGALLTAAAARTYLRFRRDLRAAEARVSSGCKLINTPYGPIEYAEAGTGTPVLVIHGAGGGFDQALEFARPLIENGFRVIAPSRFGYLGTSLQADSSATAQADAHAFLLDALQLDKVAVIGVSAGAPSAMQLALRHPDRCSALVLGVPLAYNDRPEGITPERQSAFRKALLNTMLSSDFAFWSMCRLAPKAMIRTILGTPPEDVEKTSTEEQAWVAEFLSHIAPISRRKNGLANEAAIAQSLPRYDLEKFQVPTLVFGVENCLYNTHPGARYTAAHIPGARFLSYPTGGHLAVGHQTELWSEIQKFLKTPAPKAKTAAVAETQEVLVQN